MNCVVMPNELRNALCFCARTRVRTHTRTHAHTRTHTHTHTHTHQVVLKEIKDSIELYEKGVLDALQLKLDKVSFTLVGLFLCG